MDLQTVRDWVIIAYGIFGIITFLVITVVTAVIGLNVSKLIGSIQTMVETKIAPAVNSVRRTTDSVRGGATFIMNTAAAPIIRTYGFVAGVRHGLAVLTGLRQRRRQ